tara:strand:- start:10295 stop:10690 length:396 start_codon:yes stop_codon:yes gene_type:complete
MNNSLKTVGIIFLIYIMLLICASSNQAQGGGKIYHPPNDSKKIYGTKKGYTNKQKIIRGDKEVKKYTTCRLSKTVQSKVTGQQACVYRGGNQTFELMYDNNCPKQFKCVYNPGQIEPNIDSVIESLNKIKK